MKGVITWILIVAAVVGAWIGFMFGAWKLWRWVLPQVYASGPTALLQPGFWLFVACWTLGAWLGRAIFGGKK